MKLFEDFQESEGEIRDNSWIEWEHFLVPNKSRRFREIMRRFLAIMGHCYSCTSLDGCYFLRCNSPECPRHPNCDCKS